MRIPSWLSSLARLSDSLSGPPYLADSATSNRRAAEVKHGRLSQSNHLKTGRYLTAPFAAQDWFMTMHDTAIVASTPGVLMNDMAYGGYNPTTMTYTPPGPLTASLVAGPANGAVSLNSNGSFLYTPATGFVGGDSFTYQALAGTETSNTATVSINVRNNAPSAGNDSFMTLHDQSMTAFAPGLLANDYDMDGDSITPTLVTSTSHGTLALNSNGSFIYTPNAGYVGSDSFIYKVSDGLIDSNTATVSINVRNNAPSAGNDSFMTLHNQPMTAFAPGLLANDYDMDGDSITPTLVTSTSHGTLALNSNGSFIYTPNAGYGGSDSFTYKVSDGLIDSNTATVSINVWNNVPSAGNDSFSLKHSQSFTTGLPGLLANDYDMDGDSLTISLVDHPLHGYVLINATSGGFKYVPDDEYVGVDSFTYEVTDGIAQSNLATVSLNLLDTKPNAVDDFFDDASSRVVSYFDIATILGNDSDLDDEHDSLVIDSIDAVSALGASISIVSGQLVYDPTGVAALQSLADDSVVSDVIGYAIKDPHAQLAFASINLQAKPNRPPTISKITNQITLKDKPTAGLEFDAKDHVNETAINAVTITATSSNQAVIANSGLAISTVLGSLRKNYRYSRSGGHR